MTALEVVEKSLPMAMVSPSDALAMAERNSVKSLAVSVWTACAGTGSMASSMHSVSAILKILFSIYFPSLIEYFFGPVANAHIQRAGLVQTKIGIPAVPALTQPGRCAGSRLKNGANLLGPHVALSIGSSQWCILLPAIFHQVTLLSAEVYADFSINFCEEHSTQKRKNEPLHLKDPFLHLKNLYSLKIHS
ncbi:hypothetical protein SDC9_141818 [bioreactor metagenome]|uniref:Uncharacterized protein n=1 Tax=bioreactor metagenome TaxID=1076179 RepID=A0A645DYS7_9ZZZZ